MNIVFVSYTPLAGAPIRIANALNKYTNFNVRLINLNPTLYGNRTFPEDLIWEKDKEICLQLIAQADILHFHHYFDIENENNPFGINFKKIAPNAKILRHFHTELNQLCKWINCSSSEILNDKYEKIVIPHCPERTFLDTYIVPNIIPISEDLLLPKNTENPITKVFFSASSNGSMWDARWDTKGVPEVLEKFNSLKNKEKFEFQLIQNIPYSECMDIKQKSDIVIGDTTSGSYHLTDLEALSQGKPTFTYLDGRSQMVLQSLLGCDYLPFVNTRLEEIDLPFLELVKNVELRKEIGSLSRKWIEEYYNEQKLVEFYKIAYEKLLNNEPLKRQNNLQFKNAKCFLYNDLYNMQWETRKIMYKKEDRKNKYREDFKSFFQNIFSVTNEYKNGFKKKVVKIFGIKIMFSAEHIKKPKIKNNTFLLWEPCTYSHGEIIPGFAKYLQDMGYEVSVLMTPDRITEGLFSNFKNKKIFLNKMNQNEIVKYLKKYGLQKAKGIIITTARNASIDTSNYDDKINLFNNISKVYFVEHEVAPVINNKFWKDDIITLAPIDYKDKKSVIVNPHYFGNFPRLEKNNVTKFVVVGTFEQQRKNFNMLFNAVNDLKGEDFKIIIIGNGNYDCIPFEIRQYFEIKGRLKFKDMYDCIQSCDYILALLDDSNPLHERYITTGTSGTYQLSYGFKKPLVISEKFTKNRYLDSKNAIVYQNNDLKNALKKAIQLNSDDYSCLCDNLEKTAKQIYNQSLLNLKELINGR